MHMLGYIFNRIFTELGRRNVSYFGVVWTQIFGTFSHPLNITWMSLTCTDSEERALAMAMVIMGANIAGIYGAQIFRQDDRPRYRRGFSVNIGVITFGLTIAAIRYIDDKIRKRKAAKQLRSVSDSDGSAEKVPAALPSEDQVAPIILDSGRRLSATGAR